MASPRCSSQPSILSGKNCKDFTSCILAFLAYEGWSIIESIYLCSRCLCTYSWCTWCTACRSAMLYCYLLLCALFIFMLGSCRHAFCLSSCLGHVCIEHFLISHWRTKFFPLNNRDKCVWMYRILHPEKVRQPWGGWPTQICHSLWGTPLSVWFKHCFLALALDAQGAPPPPWFDAVLTPHSFFFFCLHCFLPFCKVMFFASMGYNPFFHTSGVHYIDHRMYNTMDSLTQYTMQYKPLEPILASSL